MSLTITSWVTADNGWMNLHLWSGAAMLTLLVFRILWGLVGSTTARFRNFVAGPSTVVSYLRALTRTEDVQYCGHNPAGGWMVLALMATLCAQAATGLFANDNLGFRGPLAISISKQASDRVTEYHTMIFSFLQLLIWTHVVAVFYYLFVKGDNLVLPMFNGKKQAAQLPANTVLTFTPWPAALLLFLLASVFVWWIVVHA